jgi:hypothetical protein
MIDEEVISVLDLFDKEVLIIFDNNKAGVYADNYGQFSTAI